jgi:hypothetical protein
MSTAVIHPAGKVDVASSTQPTVAVRRRSIDVVLISIGVLAAIVFTVAGSLLTWGHNFANNYVHDELASQHITFPAADALNEEGRTDLVKYADQTVDSGKEAEAYASYINGHLAGIADGATYADLGGPERAAKADVKAATDAGKPQATVDELQAKADGITNQRNTLFKGETLRGLLLSAYAWSTVGTIAGIAAVVAFGAAAVMFVLVVLGIVHLARSPKTT